jgi:3-methyladenine DNA glycosylase AlkD
MSTVTARTIIARLEELGDEAAAQLARRFFKTGPGQYGEGDTFLGIKVGPLRTLARSYQELPHAQVVKLLHSHFHEARLLALLILVRAFERGKPAAQQAIYDLYLGNTAHINNWDLVDASAAPIVGGHLAQRNRVPLYTLARSPNLWERRIAIVATHHFIQQRDFVDTLKIAALLLSDHEDLIHKATGWMLREVGKRDVASAESFLATHYRRMPRTMLRYAIERLPATRRLQYLRGEI